MDSAGMIDILESYRGAATEVRRMTAEDKDFYKTSENWETCRSMIQESGGNPDDIYILNTALDNIVYAEPKNGVYIPV